MLGTDKLYLILQAPTAQLPELAIVYVDRGTPATYTVAFSLVKEKALVAVPLTVMVMVDPILGGYGETSTAETDALEPPQSFTGTLSSSSSISDFTNYTVAFPQTRLLDLSFPALASI